jgi:hypothetical protein
VKDIIQSIKFGCGQDLIDKINMNQIINHEPIYVSVMTSGEKIIGKIV